MLITLLYWQRMRRVLLETFGLQPLYCFLDKVRRRFGRTLPEHAQNSRQFWHRL